MTIDREGNFNLNLNHDDPTEVLNNKKISREEKISILKDWARDEYQMSVADEENMLPSRNQEYKNQLFEILEALLVLGVEFDPSGAEG